MTKAAIGIDIGGTHIKLGLVDERGKILARESFCTNSVRGRTRTLDALAGRIFDLKRCARKNRFVGVGIGAPGPIDVERGFVHFFPNIPGWKNTPLGRLLEKKLKLPVFLDNDANAMAWGEYCFGAGRGAQSLLALTLGTGIGGGIVLNGRLFHGTSYSAAEIGHLVINENGPRCSCGSRGCVETYVGNGYFVRAIQKRLRAGQKSLLRDWWLKERRLLTPLLVAEAARAGDAFSKRVWRETGKHLGTALASLVNILNPDRIILGGGIALNKALLFPAVTDAIKKNAFPVASRSVKVVPAGLGVDAGWIGAAALALYKT